MATHRKPTGDDTRFDSQFADSVKDSAQQIWQAGLAAFAKAQEQGGKVFESLVKEGVTLQKKTQTVAEEKLGDMGARAGQQWDKLEGIFEERTARALARLGVPTLQDIAALQKRIDELSAQVQALRAPAKKAVAKKAAAKKAAVKPAAKKLAARKNAARKSA